jgi:hypothetical protein
MISDQETTLVKAFCSILVGLLLVCPSHAQRDIQSLTIALSATASDAVLPISVWYYFARPAQGENPFGTDVVGTGFLINKNGDFITAGHVIDSLNLYKQSPKIKDANLTARIRNREGDGSDRQFTIIDRDNDHDLVLCHVPGVNASHRRKSKLPKNISQTANQPFASLAISTMAPQTGRLSS